MPTVQDSTVEDDETFTVTLSGVSSNAQLASDPTAKGTIVDDDDPPTSGICGRTAKIQEAILGEISGVDNCAAVTDANLATITARSGTSALARSRWGSPRFRRAISRG